MSTKKIYNNFTSKFGTVYNFAAYAEFAAFWFGMNRKTLLAYFPDNFYSLNKAAWNSTEAKTAATL